MPSSALQAPAAVAPLRPHSRLVRITHWTNTAAIVALIVSGIAILLAHPRLYWGETGAFGAPALLTLPVPLDLDQSGWGRSLHFLAAWVCVLSGLVYVGGGLASGHFVSQMLRAPDATANEAGYNRTQRVAYLAVVFVILPLAVLTGLSLSPAVMAAVPVVSAFGGHQSARTIHFFVAVAVALFLVGHVAMVCRRGFVRRMRRMVAG